VQKFLVGKVGKLIGEDTDPEPEPYPDDLKSRIRTKIVSDPQHCRDVIQKLLTD
jgi:hypothetical protein